MEGLICFVMIFINIWGWLICAHLREVRNAINEEE